MAPPFVALNITEFADLLGAWSKRARRRITEVHMHHTWRPNHAQYRGHDTIAGMWRTHTQQNGWSDIAQHVTIAPDGLIWTGRHWDLPPASSGGHNGTSAAGPFMFEMIGDFDAGKDKLIGAQRDAALWVTSLVLDAFKLDTGKLRFHRELGSPKTCPGNGVDHGAIAAAVDKLRGKAPPAAPRTRAVAGFDAVGAAQQSLIDPPVGRAESPAAEPDEGFGRAGPVSGGAPASAAARAVGSGEALTEAVLAQLRPHLVNLEQGSLSRGGSLQTTPGDLARIFEQELPARIDALEGGAKLPIVLYAHGGLTNEAKGLAIAASQTPWWTENGVYPISFVWETGLFEEAGRILGLGGAEAARGLGDELGELRDLAVEAATRPVGRRLWAAMKYSAWAAFEPGGGGAQFVEGLAGLLAKHRDRIGLHAVGHSAGSIFHSHLLGALAAADPAAKVEMLAFLAPAISVADYRARVAPLLGSVVGKLALFTMARDFELADGIAGTYGKSLLYLVANAFEAERPTPILGLEEYLRDAPDLRRTFGLDGAPGDADIVFAVTRGDLADSDSRARSHGGFDNDPATMESVLRRILRIEGNTPLRQGFPVDGIERQLELAPDAAAPAPSANRAAPQAAAPGGARLALCIGVDEYANPRDRLRGCVADALAWEAALGAQGFAVERLHNADASREAIIGRMGALLARARPGDCLVFQFAGHGTQIPDSDSDEDDSKDEAFCPQDYDQGRLIIDDDFRALFGALPAGAALTCFFDCCHSGTITRLAVGTQDVPDDSLPRFLVPDAAVISRHREFRRALGAPRAAPGDRASMRAVVFAACKPEQVALETAGRGAFSVRAVPLLAKSPPLTNRAFQAAVTEAFGPQARQDANLDCADEAFDLPLFGASAAAAMAAAPAAVPGRDVNREVAEMLRTAAALLTGRG